MSAVIDEKAKLWRSNSYIYSGSNLPKMTTDPMVRPGLAELREDLPADRLGFRAAGMEGAAGGDIHRAGRVAFEAGCWHTAAGIGDRHRLQEHFGIRMQPVLAETVPGRRFHQPA
jgi:hypothetical protein